MSVKNKHTILLVDDETSITKALNRLFRKGGYKILTAASGQEGLDILHTLKNGEENPASLIISDQRMPGMNGAAFLAKSKEIFPDAIRFLLTGYSDMDAIVDAVNKGEIHRYLTKPWNDDDIILQVRQAVKQLELQAENRRLTELTREQNRELKDLNNNLDKKVKQRTREIIKKSRNILEINKKLEKSFMDTIRLLSSLIGTLNPDLGKYMGHVARISRKIGEELDFSKKALDQIEMAGMIHDIGLLGLPKRILVKNEAQMTENEFSLYSQHPMIASMCLDAVESLGEIGEIILYHHENFDGSGFPNGIKGDAIPLEARIIGTVADYCRIIDLWPRDTNAIMLKAKQYKYIYKNLVLEKPDVMLEKIAEMFIHHGIKQKYDPEVTAVLFEITALEAGENNKKHLNLNYHDLKEGMLLEEDLRIKDGRLLMSMGTILKQAAIESIHKVGEHRLIDGTIHVSI